MGWQAKGNALFTAIKYCEHKKHETGTGKAEVGLRVL